MTIINHALVGAGIAVLIKQPLLSLPLAFLSHFLLDSLPHFGIVGDKTYEAIFKYKRTYFMVLIDVLGLAVLTVLLFGQPWYVYLAAFLAVSPDLMWLYRYFGFERFGKEPPRPGPITRFHQRIQWGERIWGVYIELPVTIMLFVLMVGIV